jgi:thiol-disulfide isomerase/thioredoxin
MLVSAHAACRPHARPVCEHGSDSRSNAGALPSTLQKGLSSRRRLLGAGLGGAALLPALRNVQRATGAPAVVELTPESFSGAVSGRAFVLFYAPWCPYCRALEPDFNALPGELEKSGVNGTLVARMDVDR